MSEAELVQHFWSSIENGLNALMMYISVFTGYLIMAYLIGARLTTVQSLIATGAFMVFSGFCIWGSMVFWTSSYIAALELYDTRPELLPFDLNPAIVSSTLLVTGVIGALKFMWDVRHPKGE